MVMSVDAAPCGIVSDAAWASGVPDDDHVIGRRVDGYVGAQGGNKPAAPIGWIVPVERWPRQLSTT